MSKPVTKEEALDYHQFPKPGKLEIGTTTKLGTQRDLALAYTPGVAFPCLEIEKNPDNAFKYTAKKNLVAVISNGTAVLGLGNIGAVASKPVMEGKAVLFKKFAAVDSFDIEVDETDVEKFVSICKAISPTFGGINLEDIKAPECFEIERRLIEEVDIPVMHDDQHGTAIITTAGLINACEIIGKKLEDLKVIVMGAGAAAISCARMYKAVGVKDIIMCDSKGVIHDARTDLNKYKKEFSIKESMTKLDAFRDADVVLGLSKPGTFTEEHIAVMADEPIVFALANPTPELFPEDILKIRDKAIVGTGRSDFNNQINNVLGFPFIFRGALDVQAKKINMQMKKAAAYAIADLAKKTVPADVKAIFGDHLTFSKEYIIPKPFDKRLIIEISSAVANAAVESGVARIKEFDLTAYKEELSQMI
ncbi:Malate dehydrogenase (oxaloacetate-decarboxylating) [Arcobacter nitrofigilis DSM 7299]|uniref:Malate dehydrogenase (Oxaloacetate-decarboxylating) n=1 Tax=Arcobacter nitrofigilis (strain ATCC 33309 / DSM 7299 / CCUG 15893 / LMG 7604 / NCTC 12251 / CI) TaxID=572480 RepID=D5V1T3_ARCNC|nr:malic enzyme-like NAD(P)-binding protein [Arcobacter nitrofigilis]ADG93517.1 Malate dehydrogenase (oxaloacetate-decarboxylating) [Arcobacter nitrofigilis DSM 7299]